MFHNHYEMYAEIDDVMYDHIPNEQKPIKKNKIFSQLHSLQLYQERH
jgi:hypothetical protein